MANIDTISFNLIPAISGNCTLFPIHANPNNFLQLNGEYAISEISVDITINNTNYNIDYFGKFQQIGIQGVLTSGLTTLAVPDALVFLGKFTLGEVLAVYVTGTAKPSFVPLKVIEVNTIANTVILGGISQVPTGTYDLYKLNTDFTIISTDLGLDVIPDSKYNIIYNLEFENLDTSVVDIKNINSIIPYICNAKCCIYKMINNTSIDECNTNNYPNIIQLLLIKSYIDAIQSSICCGNFSVYDNHIEAITKFCLANNCQPCKSC